MSKLIFVRVLGKHPGGTQQQPTLTRHPGVSGSRGCYLHKPGIRGQDALGIGWHACLGIVEASDLRRNHRRTCWHTGVQSTSKSDIE